MYKGGPSYTPKLAKTIRIVGLTAPIVFTACGIFAQMGYISSLHYLNLFGFSLLATSGLLVSLIQFLHKNRSKTDSALRLIVFHIITTGYLLLVFGVATPFAGFWIVLLLASDVYFSQKGLILSLCGFVLVVAIDLLISANLSVQSITYDLITLAAVVISGVLNVAISLAHQADHDELLISKQRETLQRDRILTIVNNLADAVLSTDTDGIVRIYNAASLNLLNTNDSLNGQHIDEVLKLADLSNNQISLFEQLKVTKGAFTRDDLFYTYDDGEEIRLEIISSPIRSNFSNSKEDEKHDGYIIIMRDVTKSKSLEEERDEFISVVSHELRTPITIVEGAISNAQIMLGRPTTTPESLSKVVTTAHDQILYLAKLVNDLSALSRAERGVSDAPVSVDVRELIHKLHDEYSQEATKKGLQLDLDIEASLGHVYTSRLYLEEILQNFITNSIKYTKEGSITIAAKQSGDRIKLSVKDTGIGISKSDQTKVFQKFYRSEDYRTRETSGTGLGLYVTVKLARKIGTHIEFTSRLNHGSTFFFSLPVSNKK